LRWLCRRPLLARFSSGQRKIVEVQGFTRFGALDGKRARGSRLPHGARRTFAVVLDRDEQQRIAEPPLRTAAKGITFNSANHSVDQSASYRLTAPPF
jgi:hypothetical protein